MPASADEIEQKRLSLIVHCVARQNKLGSRLQGRVSQKVVPRIAGILFEIASFLDSTAGRDELDVQFLGQSLDEFLIGKTRFAANVVVEMSGYQVEFDLSAIPSVSNSCKQSRRVRPA